MAEKAINLKELTAEAIDFLSRYFSIDEIILFGSYASGKNNKWSDIDLAVISPDFSGKSYEDIIHIFSELAIKCSSLLELHPYTPEDVKLARPTNFLGFILKTGKVIYKNKTILL
jgi:predicted nucleotidyltransferase